MAFRIANVEEVERVYTEDNDAWLDVRAELSKQEMNKVLEHAPRGEEPTVGAQLSFLQAYGKAITVNWSLTDSNGNPEAFTIDTYLSLDTESAGQIDKIWSAKLNKTVGVEEGENIEGKLPNSDASMEKDSPSKES